MKLFEPVTEIHYTECVYCGARINSVESGKMCKDGPVCIECVGFYKPLTEDDLTKTEVLHGGDFSDDEYERKFNK